MGSEFGAAPRGGETAAAVSYNNWMGTIGHYVNEVVGSR